jgi:hypothetical protein
LNKAVCSSSLKGKFLLLSKEKKGRKRKGGRYESEIGIWKGKEKCGNTWK